MTMPGPMEMGIILVIVVLIFGTGKISGLGKSLGTAINDFKGAMKSGGEDEEKPVASAASEEKKEDNAE